MNPFNVDFCGFYTLEEGKKFRERWGGWIFVSEFGHVMWFDAKFTPSKIFMHQVTRGMSGELV